MSQHLKKIVPMNRFHFEITFNSTIVINYVSFLYCAFCIYIFNSCNFICH